MGELVDQNDLRTAGNDGVEVHFLEPLPPVFQASARNDFQTLEQRFGFLAAVGLDDADDDVVPVLLAGAGLLQHLVGLADARRRADEDSELANAAVFAARRFEQGFRRGPMFVIAPLIRHRWCVVWLNVSTLSGRDAVERKVKQQHIHARLAQKAEESPFGIVLDELANAIFGQIAGFGNARHLE